VAPLYLFILQPVSSAGKMISLTDAKFVLCSEFKDNDKTLKWETKMSTGMD
jgi:hypothetical protein